MDENLKLEFGKLYFEMEKSFGDKWISIMFSNINRKSQDPPTKRVYRPQIRDVCLYLYFERNKLMLSEIQAIVRGNLEFQTVKKIIDEDGIQTGLLKIRRGSINPKTGKKIDNRIKHIELTPLGKKRIQKFLKYVVELFSEKISNMT